MKDYRVISTVSPEFEVQMYENLQNPLLYSSLNQTISFFKQLKNSTVFVLPVGLKGVLSADARLRILKEKIINDSQSNVFFDDNNNAVKCQHPDFSALFVDHQSATITTKC